MFPPEPISAFTLPRRVWTLMSVVSARLRAAVLRMFGAKIGRDTALVGEMRTRANNGKPVLYFETNDAGALFRFTDMYQRMVGGKMWIGMDPPNQDGSAQEGVINVSAFSIRGDSTLDRVVSSAPKSAISTGTAHVAYLPAGKVVGLSKLARVVDSLARRPSLATPF